ncbi:DUF1491 family protein [Sphingomonas sp. So64.6b]|uniref:DUF1491 family protein n=1 Tax=Sphingomonas sp. So64.6b TaxID=2997354 RepID=UPI00160325F8|nr:DUF1491 family protein [Sphingomonas sp. So64.6b]QNA85841.1 DUF1491 family protein [Sphingomonas sp. So64.6b]
MSGRLPSGILVSALLRRVNDAGGMGMLLARGDDQAGAILIIALENGRNPRALERGIGPEGSIELIESAREEADKPGGIEQYWQRRRSRDPDLWVIELDIPFAERFAAETILDD